MAPHHEPTPELLKQDLDTGAGELYGALLDVFPTRPEDVPPDLGNVLAASESRMMGDRIRFDAVKRRHIKPVTKMPSGLNEIERATCRDIVCAAQVLMLQHAALTHYTETSPARWQGILERKLSAKHEYPTEADCSADVSWGFWNALAVRFHLKDILNGEAWKAGYTGTLVHHGVPIKHSKNWIRADYALYGDPFGATGHTATLVGRDPHTGKHMVISDGSEGGPYLLPIDYRTDLFSVHRVI